MEQLKQLALTWFRAAAAAVVALYIAGDIALKLLLLLPLQAWLVRSLNGLTHLQQSSDAAQSSNPNTPSKPF
jgi:hypothetical protein